MGDGARVVEPHDVGDAGEREDRRAHVAIDGVVGDACRHLAHALAACPFLSGQLLLVGEEAAGVHDTAFGATRQIKDPQAGHRISAPLRAEERHAAAVGRGSQRPRRAEAKASCAGPLPRIGLGGLLGHGPIVPHD